MKAEVKAAKLEKLKAKNSSRGSSRQPAQKERPVATDEKAAKRSSLVYALRKELNLNVGVPAGDRNVSAPAVARSTGRSDHSGGNAKKEANKVID